MNIIEALTQLRNKGIKELDIYWLEENKEGDEYWWCDVVNDSIVEMSKLDGWIWTVMSRVEYENEEVNDPTREEEDWFIIVDEEKFSDDLVCDHIKQWLGDRGFDFKVNVIDPDGTIESNRILAMAEEAKEKGETCLNWTDDRQCKVD